MKSKFQFLSIILFLLSFCSLAQTPHDTSRVVKIGKQEWMATNLNLRQFRNGDQIPQAKTPEEWQKANDNATPAWCYYNYDSTNDIQYGKLYNWYAVSDPRGLAPIGWQIPSELDWDNLAASLGSEDEIGIKMKTKEGWQSIANGTNESNFSALPSGGCRRDGTFYGLGSLCYWWSSSENEMNLALFRLLSNSDNEFGEGYNGKGYGLSIRCIKINL